MWLRSEDEAGDGDPTIAAGKIARAGGFARAIRSSYGTGEPGMAVAQGTSDPVAPSFPPPNEFGKLGAPARVRPKTRRQL